MNSTIVWSTVCSVEAYLSAGGYGTTFDDAGALTGSPEFPAQGVSDSDRRYRMTYRNQHGRADNEARGHRDELPALGLARRRAGHCMFAVVPEQVVPSRVSCGGVLRVLERPCALRFPESSRAYALAAPEFLHGRDVLAS